MPLNKETKPNQTKPSGSILGSDDQMGWIIGQLIIVFWPDKEYLKYSQ